MNKQKQKKSIFITGITSGIGSVIFDLCQKNEFDIAAVVRQEDQLNELKNKNYSSLDLYQADLSNKQDVQKLINQIKNMRFDYVLLNAGYALMGAFHELPMESIDKIIEANLLSNMRLTRAFLSNMNHHQTKFIFVSSIAARLPAHNFASYAVSKAGLSHFCNSLRREYPRLSFLCIEIGAVNTPLHNKAGNNVAQKDRFKSAQVIGQRIFKAMHTKEGVVTLSGDWWLMRKIAMCADQWLTNVMLYLTRRNKS